MPPANSNIGALLARLLAEGLVPVRQQISIESNEWGAKQMQRDYACLNAQYPALEPAFGTAPIAPADMDLSFLGKHSARFTRSTHSPAIGNLSVVYKGAVFPGYSADDPDAITTPWSPPVSSQAEQITFGYFADATSTGYQAQIAVDYLAQNLHFQYVARSKPTRARFIKPAGDTFTANASTDLLTGPALADGDIVILTSTNALPAPLAERTVYYVRDSTGTTYKLAATSGGSAINITGAGTGTHSIISLHILPVINRATAANAFTAAGRPFGMPVPVPATALDGLSYIVALTEFAAVPCGNFWEVTETGTVKIEPPQPTDIVV
jgi:hypothetical protein